MPRQRCRLRGDAFHQAAVAANGINAVIENVESRLVIAASQPLLGNGHTHTRGDALSERAGGRLDARDPVVFRMARRFAVDLAKTADVIERNRGWPRRSYSALTAQITMRVMWRPLVRVRIAGLHLAVVAWQPIGDPARFVHQFYVQQALRGLNGGRVAGTDALPKIAAEVAKQYGGQSTVTAARVRYECRQGDAP